MNEIADLVARIHSGEAAPDEGVRVAEDRIAALNPVLNAIADHDPDATAPQLAALALRLKSGERPLLAGVPVTVKDQFHVAGWPVTEGSALLAGRVARADEPVVARLRRAGAIIIGRSIMSEFGCKGVTDNRIHGATRHPLDPRLTPGGSSGGAAVAVASGMGLLALAADGGGSIRRPAAHVGVVGFKPSTGALPLGVGLSHTAVPGLMARDVAGIALAFEALRGAEASDPISLDLPDRKAAPAALTYAWAPDLGLGIPLDDAAHQAAERARTRIAAAGYRLRATPPRWPEGASEAALMPLQHAALAARWGRQWQETPDLFDPHIAGQIASGMALGATNIARADLLSREIARAAAGFFAKGPDLLLALTAPCAAWPLDRLGPERIGGAPAGPRDHAALTPLVNHAFLPAISIPCGRDAAGLPFGLQIIGPRLSDLTVLRAAMALAPLVNDEERKADGP